eukprot:COSAG02_NODE_2674_length_8282_cov_200.926922_2_plen_201_part_00
MTTRRCSRHQITRPTSCRASSGATRTCPSAPILPTPRPDKTRWLRWRCVLRTATAAVHLTHSCAAASCADCTAVAAVRQPHRKRLPGASGALLTGRGACALRTYGPDGTADGCGVQSGHCQACDSEILRACARAYACTSHAHCTRRPVAGRRGAPASAALVRGDDRLGLSLELLAVPEDDPQLVSSFQSAAQAREHPAAA